MWTLAFGQHEDRMPTRGYEPTREAAMAALTAGVVLRSGGRSAFGGKPEKHTLVLSLTASDPNSVDLPIGLSHRPRDGSVVSSLHCMNDPHPEGRMASYIRRRKFLATLLGGVAASLAGSPFALARQAAMPVIGFVNAGSAK